MLSLHLYLSFFFFEEKETCLTQVILTINPGIRSSKVTQVIRSNNQGILVILQLQAVLIRLNNLVTRDISNLRILATRHRLRPVILSPAILAILVISSLQLILLLIPVRSIPVTPQRAVLIRDTALPQQRPDIRIRLAWARRAALTS